MFVSSIDADHSEFYKKDLKDEILALLGNSNIFLRKAGYLSDVRLLILRASTRLGDGIELAQNRQI